jgi:hypothetical protein
MVKRLVALLFILVIAGQVSAGVCGCIGNGGKQKHSCCKRKKVGADSLSRKGCCGTNCMVRQSGRIVQDGTSPAPEIKFQTLRDTTPVIAIGFEPVALHRVVFLANFSNHRLRYSRPPDLFLLHRAFLI